MDWQTIAVSPDQSIEKAMKVIDDGGLQIALVVDHHDRLQGVVTDGDVRRGILQGYSLDGPTRRIMTSSPITVRPDEDRQRLLNTMQARHIQQVPVVDASGRVVGIEILSNLLNPTRLPNRVVVMAGGMGTRLSPLTDECPKPLLEIGGKPILETILENLSGYGFHRFYFSVNYRSEMIEEYFGNGSAWGVDIKYVREDKRLGTAGPLSLLPEVPSVPFIVMNGDLLTTLNFRHLLSFHDEQHAVATMCVREHSMQVPYGVVEVEDSTVTSIREKPTERYFVNAGVYAFAPEVLALVPTNQYFDMPNLFDAILESEGHTTAFPICEYWQDVGQKQDFHRARVEYEHIFS
jgi:dTDP-glucose pyrophosphorylase